MSSIYRAICLSHTPAIALDKEWHSGHDGRSAIYGAIKSQFIEGHTECDLLMGRYSYPLVEIGCPGAPHCRNHHGPIWIHPDWLRLLSRAISWNLEIPYTLTRSCWTLDRLKKIRLHLFPAQIEEK